MKFKGLKILYIVLIFALAFTAFNSCNDPVFYRISEEIPLVPPLIRGSPSNFALFEDPHGSTNYYTYVATGRNLFRFRENYWAEMTGNMALPNHITGVIQLAATDDYLYALCFRETSTAIIRELWRYDGTNWTQITGTIAPYTEMQTIFSANNRLFIGAHRNGTVPDPDNHNRPVLYHAILYVNNNNIELTNITEIRSLLRGAAFDGTNIFLCTGSNIFVRNSSGGGSNSDISGDISNFQGIIALPDDTVVAITLDGRLFEVDSTGIVSAPTGTGNAPWPITSFGDGRSATGALAIWQDDPDPNTPTTEYRLLVGRRDIRATTMSGHTFGYVELELSNTGGIAAGENSFETPDVHAFSNTIGAIIVNHLFQPPCGSRILASTQRRGVWSYRHRAGDSHRVWNAETNDPNTP
ncbi:MAG: hypothetical protein FWC97_09900 [Treponema sp.]|nr:hypothetical protein [Treponema sp.]